MKTTAVSANNRWTEADLDKLASLKVMNTSVADIAKNLCRTVKAVRSQLYAAVTNKTKTGQRLQHLIGVKSQAAQQMAAPEIKVSSLVTATAGIWKSFAGTGPWGIALAVAGTALMWGSFAAAKIKAAQITKKEYSVYRDW